MINIDILVRVVLEREIRDMGCTVIYHKSLTVYYSIIIRRQQQRCGIWSLVVWLPQKWNRGFIWCITIRFLGPHTIKLCGIEGEINIYVP